MGKLCYDFSKLEKFLNQKSVQAALGVGNNEFVSCSTAIYKAMLVDWMRNLEVGIPNLLKDGINMLIYAGEYDLICNWLGTPFVFILFYFIIYISLKIFIDELINIIDIFIYRLNFLYTN